MIVKEVHTILNRINELNYKLESTLNIFETAKNMKLGSVFRYDDLSDIIADLKNYGIILEQLGVKHTIEEVDDNED